MQHALGKKSKFLFGTLGSESVTVERHEDSAKFEFTIPTGVSVVLSCDLPTIATIMDFSFKKHSGHR